MKRTATYIFTILGLWACNRVEIDEVTSSDAFLLEAQVNPMCMIQGDFVEEEPGVVAYTLSLLLQVCAVLHRVNNGDFTGLTRSMPIILPAAVVIAAGTAALNLAAYVKHRRRKK